VTLNRRGRGVLVTLGVACLVAAGALAVSTHPPTSRLGRGSGCATESCTNPEGVARRHRGAATPAFSVRRVPALVSDPASRMLLDRRLAGATGGSDSCVVVQAAGETIDARAPDAALQPASTMKLITSIALLDALGARTRLATRVVAPRPASDGTVTGDLFLVGGGDPTLGTARFAQLQQERPRYRDFPVTSLEALADRVVAAGVRRIDGRVVGDDSAQSTLRFLPVWEPSYRIESGPLGALVVNQGFVPGTSTRVPDPALDAAATFAQLLQARGVDVTGGAGHATAPHGLPEIARIESPPVSAIVTGLLTASDNFSAEVLTRAAGRLVRGDGSTDAGTRVTIDRAGRAGVDTHGLVLDDGSGLARSDRATCRALVDAVGLATSRRAYRAIELGLPVAGRTGTLSDRFAGTDLVGRLHAKTGNIDGVVALAGTVDSPRHPIFAFVANGPFSKATGEVMQGAIAEAVLAYPEVAPHDIAPTP
jgi:serine-type D-Ala-D-Ala carboxypeptidase/endopeptidase (penicillin-binding protein 4)